VVQCGNNSPYHGKHVEKDRLFNCEHFRKTPTACPSAPHKNAMKLAISHDDRLEELGRAASPVDRLIEDVAGRWTLS
jgi:hypothetical protein